MVLITEISDGAENDSDVIPWIPVAIPPSVLIPRMARVFANHGFVNFPIFAPPPPQNPYPRRFFRNAGRMIFPIIERFPALPMVLLLGGTLYLTGFEWSSFEAPYVSEEEVSGLLNHIGMQFSFIRSPVGRFLWGRASSALTSWFAIPPTSFGLYRAVMSWLRFIGLNFLWLSPNMQLLALWILFILSIIVATKLMSLSWAAFRRLRILLGQLFFWVLHYMFPNQFPNPFTSQSTFQRRIIFHGPVVFHGPIVFHGAVTFHGLVTFNGPDGSGVHDVSGLRSLLTDGSSDAQGS